MRRKTVLTVAAAMAMFAGIFAAWLTVGDASDPPEHLYALPIALVAVMLGKEAGLLAGLLALLLAILQRRIDGLDVGAGMVYSRMATYFLLGGVLGHYVERGRQIQRDLEEAESGHRGLLERVPAIVYTAEYGAEGRWSFVSPKIEPILGYSVEEWCAEPKMWYRRLHPDDRDQALAAEERSSSTGEPLDSEYRMIARDGKVLWFRDQATVVHDEQGDPMLLQGVMLDITSRKRAEDELELRYAVQRKFAESASLNEGLYAVLRTISARFAWEVASYWAVDEQEEVLRVASMWHEEALEAEPFETASRGLALARGEGLPGSAWAAGEPVCVEDVVYDPNFPRASAAEACDLHGAVAFPVAAGHRVHGVLEFFSREPRTTDPEEVALLSAVSTLVADFVATRVTIEEARARFQAVLDNAPAVVFAKDLSGRYLFVNRRLEQVLGQSSEEIEGKTNYELFPPEIAAVLGEHDRQVIQAGNQIEFEEVLPHEDGIHNYLTVKFPLRDAGGAIYAVCGISTDVTELKRAQQELDRREELVRANRAKSAFLSRVSHELRTPLNAILGFGQVLEVDSITDRQRNAVDQIMKGGRHLLELVNDLLEVSRIESGELSVSLGEVDVGTTVDDIAHLVQPLAAERNVSLVTRVDPAAPRALADGQRLKQVILNLLSNAIKYNRHGGGVDLHVKPGREGHVAVRITDTGLGIAPDHLDLLFSPFERLGAEQTTIEGTGLGLALSKLMVDAMNGTLAVESVQGEGSTFTVELPAAPARAGAGGEDHRGKELLPSGR